MSIEQSLRNFVVWWREHIKGDEKGEAQIFLDHLMRAFGHAGAIEAGGNYETRVRRRRNGKATVSFADYLLPKRVLIEMKKRGEDLKRHYTQLEEYWKSLDSQARPRYALLCNFDAIWIYDFQLQFYDPVDTVQIAEIFERRAALEFLVARSRKAPVFRNNRVEVTKDAAFQLTELFRTIAPDVGNAIAQRFTLQCMVALFAEDAELLPKSTLSRIIEDVKFSPSITDNSHDLMALLFIMMNYPKHRRRSGRFHDVDYFNGGIFDQIHPILLHPPQVRMLELACDEDWSKIRPSIFGNIFEYSMDKRERHKEGAHYTTELDIKRIVDPVIAEPWRDDIESVNALPDALALYDRLCEYIVLDPACGSGNFLYVAYREMKALEAELRERIAELGGDLSQLTRRVTAKQFYGYDINEFAVELAKVSLMIAKKLAADEFDTDENPLPLDNLDDNIRVEDALFNDWVEFDACIGNPPYLGGSTIGKERGIAYLSEVREKYADVPGRADYCVYWFRKAHDNMKVGSRAGLVGTNTIRQNFSRIGGLDYILANGGEIYDAVSSMPWSGEAKVHVSIANWCKGVPPFAPRLHFYAGQNEAGEYAFRTVIKDRINAALSDQIFVSGARKLAVNIKPKRVFQGIIPGHHGFRIDPDKAEQFIRSNNRNREILKPYLIGDDLLGQSEGQPSRYVIDFFGLNILEARAYSKPFELISQQVLPERKRQAEGEITLNRQALSINPNSKTNNFYQRLLDKWWRHITGRVAMTHYLKTIRRYVACSRVTKRPVFDFVSNSIRPDSSLKVFGFEDDYSFGVLQSNAHWQWFTQKGSTLTERFRYTSHSVFDTFPFPQQPASEQVKVAAAAARALHEYRREAMAKSESDLTLRDMYRTLELPGKNPLRDLHDALDAAVLAAYGFDPDRDILEQLLALNFEVAAKIEAGEAATAPGIPPDYPDPSELISDGCIQPPDWF